MDSGNKTTRKGFIQRSALAVAGFFGASAVFAGSKTERNSTQSKSGLDLPAQARIRQPHGIVSRSKNV